MPFDKLDKKAREAAEQYNAEYNEEAWSKMEALLDKHMPLNVAEPEAKKRKFHEKWLFLLLSLLAVSSITLLIKPWGIKNEHNTIIEKTGPGNPVENNVENKSVAINPGDNNNNNTDSKATDIYTSKEQSGATSLSATPGNNIAQKNYAKKIRSGKGSLSYKSTGNEIGETESETEQPDIMTQSQSPFFKSGFINQKIDNRFTWNKNIITNKISVSNTLPKNKIALTKTKNLTDKKKNRFANSFSVNLSAGPDISAINVNNIGTFEILYGIGIGYKFANRWQVRTGFYTAKKVYNANPGDYNPPAMFWNYYPYLEDISADCKVNEIPLIINYSLGQNAKRCMVYIWWYIFLLYEKGNIRLSLKDADGILGQNLYDLQRKQSLPILTKIIGWLRKNT